jgi:thioredoxin-related protein
MEELQKSSSQSNKLIFLYVFSSQSDACQKFQNSTLSDPSVHIQLSQFHSSRIDTGDSLSNNKFVEELDIKVVPSFIFLDDKGEILTEKEGAVDTSAFLRMLRMVSMSYSVQTKAVSRKPDSSAKTSDGFFKWTAMGMKEAFMKSQIDYMPILINLEPESEQTQADQMMGKLPKSFLKTASLKCRSIWLENKSDFELLNEQLQLDDESLLLLFSSRQKLLAVFTKEADPVELQDKIKQALDGAEKIKNAKKFEKKANDDGRYSPGFILHSLGQFNRKNLAIVSLPNEDRTHYHDGSKLDGGVIIRIDLDNEELHLKLKDDKIAVITLSETDTQLAELVEIK